MHGIARKKNFSPVDKIGFAVEYFPHYVNLKARMHSVDLVLISVIFRGKGFHQMESSRFEEAGKSAAITYCGEKHSIVTDRDGMEIMNVYIDPEKFTLPPFPPEIQNTLMNFIPLHGTFKNHFNRLLRIEFEDMENLRVQLFAIERELKEKKAGAYESAAAYFRIFLIECARQIMSSGLISASADANPVMEKVQKYIDKNYREPLTLEKVAKHAGLCPNYFCRFFKLRTGKTLYEYLIQKRMQAALWKLRNSDEKIFSIAYESGFNDLSYFNRLFKKMIACPPGEYRKKCMKPE